MKQNIQVPLLTKVISGNYLAHWLNLFIKAGFISSEHLLYQTVDAFICEQMNQPNPVTNWTQWPTLSSFCESMFDIILPQEKVTDFFSEAKGMDLKMKETQLHQQQNIAILDHLSALWSQRSYVLITTVAII